MKHLAIAVVFFAIAFPAQAAEWQAREQVKSYAISGTTGPELYASIGEKGPLIGKTRTIALTNWDLKWSRTYEPQGSSCRLVSAKPFLTITYSLPKPASTLGSATGHHWKTFIDGIAAHEKVHGGDIRAMVDDIIAATVGLTIENDPACKLIRSEVLTLVKAANEAYKIKSRTFDQAEMSDGGNVHRLILGLVNGR